MRLQTWNQLFTSCSFWSQLQARGLVSSEVPPVGLGQERLPPSSYCQSEFLACRDLVLMQAWHRHGTWKEGKELVLKANGYNLGLLIRLCK